MCGICGIIPRGKTSESDISSVRKMNDALIHRGPNSEGYFHDTRLAIGMRRLSIIDLGTGSQPLYNEDQTIVLIANGEIYNYIELRDELKTKGHKFATGSDCETIIHAYEEYGDRFIDHLRGMFAFCLYDKNLEKVILARDRMGEKPLYTYHDDKILAFSSELKSLLKAVPEERCGIDRESIYLYFHYGYIPGARTMFKKISKLLPAHIITIDLKSGSVTDTSYWDKSKPAEQTDITESPEKIVRAQLDTIENIIIRSDVPVGISLSGGIDSSLIASLAKRYSKNPLHAFSVGYPGYPENDERRAAEKLANELGLIFHSIEISEQDFVRDFANLVSSMDDPISDIAAYGYYTVSKFARKENIPVLLAGFGGDELFWGYPWVREAARINDLKKDIFGKVAALSSLTKQFWKDTIKKPLIMIPNVFRMSFSDSTILYELAPQWIYTSKNERVMFGKKFLSQINQNAVYKAEERKLNKNSGITVTEMITDLWLVSNCIDLGDRMSMANSIELRLPLVDYKLYEDVTRIRNSHPKDYKLGYKYWLINAVKNILPIYILDAKKRGFTPPTNSWVEHALSTHKEILLDGYLIKSGAINKKFMLKALSSLSNNIKFLYAALVLEMWAKKYIK